MFQTNFPNVVRTQNGEKIIDNYIWIHVLMLNLLHPFTHPCQLADVLGDTIATKEIVLCVFFGQIELSSAQQSGSFINCKDWQMQQGRWSSKSGSISEAAWIERRLIFFLSGIPNYWYQWIAWQRCLVSTINLKHVGVIRQNGRSWQ